MNQQSAPTRHAIAIFPSDDDVFDVKRVSWSLHVRQSRARVAWRKESNSFTLRQKKGAQKAPTVTDV